MWKIFEIGTNISTPLALSGLIATICFFILKQIINKNIYPQLTKKLTSSIIHSIINKLFVLSVISLLLGFSGWLCNNFNKNRQTDTNSFQTIEGTIIVDNKECEDITINILELEKTVKTNYFGKFILLINTNINTRYDNLTFKISADNFELDTLITLQKKDYLENIRFTFSTPKTKYKKPEFPYNNTILKKIKEAENFYKAGNADGKNRAIEIYFEISYNLTKSQIDYLQNKNLLLKANIDYKNQDFDNALLKYYQVFHFLINN